MEYQRTIALQGESEKAFAFAVNIFVQNNFLMKKLGSGEVELTGPGMNSTHQNPLTGVSRARLKLLRQKIQCEAEFGGVKTMQWFIILFPPGLGLFLFVLFALIQQNLRPALPALLAVSPWVILGPMMSRWIKRRTEKALDILLDNAAQQ
ncbi:MAG: hypothetical protein JXR73_07855 [Candidatus Omnitrophica bacterium]|nr:hypothetical protein [Candidatus Omnitrophota bacterium]